MAFFDKLFNSGNDKEQSKLAWNLLERPEDLEAAIALSYNQPVAIFKHSTRCSISSVAKDRLERSWDFPEDIGPIMFYLDLISYRSISNEIAERLKVHHESPQLILIRKGEAIYDASHNYISVAELKEALS
jgi:bacillithiol system protein YtxJ